MQISESYLSIDKNSKKAPVSRQGGVGSRSIESTISSIDNGVHQENKTGVVRTKHLKSSAFKVEDEISIISNSGLLKEPSQNLSDPYFEFST
jgi:hypothetical protein